ncbi:MAG: hypothetical protein OHK0048_26620 [Rhodoferax sp.]
MIPALLLLACETAAAGDCWVASVENQATGYGDAITARRHSGMLATLRKAEALLKDDSAINAMPNVRYQPHLYIGAPYHAGAPKSAQAVVFLHPPEMWSGRCGLKPGADIVHFAELEVTFNDLTALGAKAEIGGGGLSDAKYFVAPQRAGEHDGVTIYENAAGNHVLVLTHRGVPAFLPLTVGEYLDDWHARLSVERAEMRRNLQPLTEDQEWKTHIAEMRKTDPKGAAELHKEMEEAARLAQAGDPHGNEEWEALQRLRRTLTRAERAQPVFVPSASVEPYRFGYVTTKSEDACALVKINPALWAGTGNDDAVRTVVLRVLVQDGESTRRAGADRWLERVDLRPYRALLEGQ